jgi:hypothetical protein
VYHPAELVHVAGPSAPITGIVRDADTKLPLAGVMVKSQARHGERINGLGEDFVRAVTDTEGRYRLLGMPIGSENRIAAIAPYSGIPYLSMSKKSATSAPARPVDRRAHRRQTNRQGIAWKRRLLRDERKPELRLRRIA